MFSLLPYPAQEQPKESLGAQPLPGNARICVVANSTDLSPATIQMLRHWRDEDRSVVLLDVASTGAVAVESVDHVLLCDSFAPQHQFTPLVSLCCYHWLRTRPFDLVVFCPPFGSGYYSMVAKNLGLAFQQTGLMVLAESSHGLHLEQANRFPRGRTDLELDFLERQTLQRADSALISEQFLSWSERCGWRLPSRWRRETTTFPDAADATPAQSSAVPHRDAPFISVCLPTYNRPDLLTEAIDSLRRQSSDRFEVIVVDDGSTAPEVAACLDGMRDDFARRGWRILHQPNSGPSAARRLAAQHAVGPYLLLMDDDNLALADEIERFALAAATSDADIITCIPGHHPGTNLGPDAVAHLPTGDTRHALAGVDWTPVGASLALCAMINCLGDNNALFRRSAFLELGGFAETRMEDFHLMIQAVVRGYRLEILPEILFLYRRHDQSRSMAADVFSSHVGCASRLSEMVPPDLWPLLLMVHGDWYERHRAHTADTSD